MMWEFQRRESHLLSGIGVQIVIVGLLVFAYTQAFRQLKHERGLQLRLQEQLTMAREEVARRTEAHPQLSVLESKIKEIQFSWVGPEELPVQAARLKRLAEEFQVQDTQMKVADLPSKTLQIPVPGKESLEIRLHPVEITGSAEPLWIAALLTAVNRSDEKLLCPLSDLQLRSSERGPVQAMFRWLVPISSQSLPRLRTEEPKPPSSAQTQAGIQRKKWGWRLDPFVSPLVSPGVLRIPVEELAPFKLEGILWDPGKPSCILNGVVLKPGERWGEAEVVLITKEAVILERKGREFLLRQP